MRATFAPSSWPCSSTGRGITWKVPGSGIATMSDSSIGVEARDRRAVEAHPVVERARHLGRRHRERLEMALEVGEPEEDVLDLLVLHPLQHRTPRRRRSTSRGPWTSPSWSGSPPRCSSVSPSGFSSLETTKAPDAVDRARGPVASKSMREIITPTRRTAPRRRPPRGRRAVSPSGENPTPARRHAVAATRATLIEVTVPSAPIAGPPVHCPTASAWLTIESVVALTARVVDAPVEPCHEQRARHRRAPRKMP